VSATLQSPAIAHRKVNKRLYIPKLLFWPLMAMALVTQSVYLRPYGFWNTTWDVIAFLILLTAAMGRVWASAYISGRKNRDLVVDGPYSITRNPLYFFSFLGYIGIGLAFQSLVIAGAFAIAFFLTHWATILAEEKKLHGIFGETFDNYCRQVPRFFPRFGNFTVPEYVTFNPKFFNRAVLDCGLLMSVFILAHFIDWLHTYMPTGWNHPLVPPLIHLP
jgi:protein-S-isoprenylcysteine O-methyltransferase Ste14